MINNKLKTQALGFVCTIVLLGMVILISVALKVNEIHSNTVHLGEVIKSDPSYVIDLENTNAELMQEVESLKLDLSISNRRIETLKRGTYKTITLLDESKSKEIDLLKKVIRDKDLLLASKKAKEFSDVLDHDLLTENRKLRNDLMVEKSKSSALEKISIHKEAASGLVIEDLKRKLSLCSSK
ncbi:hypothetical protein PQC39_gp092 [Vibrio phage Vp_R1]|uniref:Uncharacterized protein n=1 Tax=Vibrio phage Vp_R1 TaxID=2059867 RepID=A0A2H5BQM5_9CAUD|nr:hypothetical protein PQC39_gp092 [Vibrio phage Vp_R1]AUG88456.1 hypothetical protein VPR_092 [Vibrio phage Vp_R1]